MGKTYKDQKNYTKYRKAKRQLFEKKYLTYMRNGPAVDHEYVPSEIGELLLEDEGNHCPHCGDETIFDRGFLQCKECGWVDAGREAILPEEAA